MRTTNTKARKEARGNIATLTTHEDRPIAILADGSSLAIEYDPARPMPTVRAAEVDTLKRDKYLADLLIGCKNMDERKAVLIPLALAGYAVKDGTGAANYCSQHDLFDCWLCATPQGSPEPEPASEPEPTPPASHPGFDPSDFVSRDVFDRAVEIINAKDDERRRQIDGLGEKIDTLAPTVVQIAGREPVTLPAGEIVHEATQAVIEDMEDGLHVYLTGEPGVGKSRMAATVAKAFGFTPERTHFFSVSNMDQKNSLLGFIRPTDGEFVPGPLYHAWKGDFAFLDELDAGNGSAMNALNAALDSPFLTFPNGETIERPEQVFILGAGNTTGKGGDMMFMRNQMDSATRNRWVFHHVDYDRNIERTIVTGILGDKADAWLAHCWKVRERLDGERIVFSTRNITAGAKMLRRGRDIATITERALLPGESRDIVVKSGALNF